MAAVFCITSLLLVGSSVHMFCVVNPMLTNYHTCRPAAALPHHAFPLAECTQEVHEEVPDAAAGTGKAPGSCGRNNGPDLHRGPGASHGENH